MRLSEVYIAGMGVRLGEFEPVATAIEEGRYTAEDADRSQALGVTVAEDRVTSVEYARQAAHLALAQSGHDAGDLVGLLHAEVLGDEPEMCSPASLIQASLGAGADCLVSAVNQGCNALIATEWALDRLMARRGAQAVMVTAADFWRLPVVERWKVSKGFPCGDGAGAVVYSRKGGWGQVLSLVTETVPELEGVSRGDGRKGPETWPIVLDDRAEHFANRHGHGRVEEIKDDAVRSVVDRATREAGVKLRDIKWMPIPHLARGLTEREVCQPLGFALEQTTWELGRRWGHLGAADVLVGLETLRQNGSLKPGDLALLMAYGGGFTWSAMVVRMTDQQPVN